MLAWQIAPLPLLSERRQPKSYSDILYLIMISWTRVSPMDNLAGMILLARVSLRKRRDIFWASPGFLIYDKY